MALAAFAAILGFCIGCFIVKKIQAKLDCLNKGESYINIHVKEVLAYIIRNVHHTWELLVFEHQNIPEAGIQILGGTFESCDRDWSSAVLREMKEEAGIDKATWITEILFKIYYHKSELLTT